MAEIEMVTVRSSNVAAVGYDDEEGELIVEFKSGARYAYEGVPYHVFEEMREADTAGSYLNLHIKNAYTARKL